MDIFVLKDGQQRGPYGLDSLRVELVQGRYTSSDLAWHQGLAEWIPISDLLVRPIEDPPKANGAPSDPPPNTTPEATSEPTEAGMLIRKDGNVAKWTPKDILGELRKGELLPTDECWNPEWSQWVPLSGIPELAKAAGIPYQEPRREVLRSPTSLFQHPDFGQIRDTEHAHRMIKLAAWFYYALAALDFLLSALDAAFLVVAVLILPLALLLHLKKSRKAAGGLLFIAVFGVIGTVLSLGSIPGGAILFVGIVTLLQLHLSIQAFKATRFLKKPTHPPSPKTAQELV
jgi:hypothetical protein